jgi:hypothetical protein
MSIPVRSSAAEDRDRAIADRARLRGKCRQRIARIDQPLHDRVEQVPLVVDRAQLPVQQHAELLAQRPA